MIVVDASVALKWVKEDEDGRIPALFLLQQHLEGHQTIIVPPFLYLEVANALVTKSNTRAQTIRRDLMGLFQTRLVAYEPTDDDLLKTAVLSKKLNTSVYDMLYAVIAKNHQTVLVTADERFIKKTKFRFVKPLSSMSTKRSL